MIEALPEEFLQQALVIWHPIIDLDRSQSFVQNHAHIYSQITVGKEINLLYTNENGG